MNFGPIIRKRFALLPLAAILPIKLLCAQDTGPTAEAVVAPIIIRASSVTAHPKPDQFLAGFITAAGRLKGARFIAYLTTATKTRPDLALQLVVCALNITRLNINPSDGHLPLATIDQIVRTVVTGAPDHAAEIVEAAINSEPYACACIVAAAVAAAPEHEAEIHTAASCASTGSMLAFAVFPAFNPVINGGLGPVTSPEQPPVAP
jgi:hypothetical protein